jgi:hypothetical protein
MNMATRQKARLRGSHINDETSRCRSQDLSLVVTTLLKLLHRLARLWRRHLFAVPTLRITSQEDVAAT